MTFAGRLTNFEEQRYQIVLGGHSRQVLVENAIKSGYEAAKEI
jgi:hypothetical protein